MVNADIVISYDVFRRNIWQQYIPLLDHFRVEVEIYSKFMDDNEMGDIDEACLRLILRRFSGHITNTIFTFHISTMSYFNFKT